MASYKKETQFRNYGQISHRHQKCNNIYSSFAICCKSHSVKSVKCLRRQIVDSTSKHLFPQGSFDNNNDPVFSNPNDFCVKSTLDFICQCLQITRSQQYFI